MLRDLFRGGLASKECNARHEKEWFFLEGVIFFLEGVIPSKKKLGTPKRTTTLSTFDCCG